MFTKSIGLAVAISISICAYASDSPDRFPVRAAFLPISDGSYHVVILTQDAAFPKYCLEGWRTGLIQTQGKSASGGAVTNPGCWGQSQTNNTFFRYFDLAAGSVREFPINVEKMMPMMYEWRTERLFPRGN